MYSPGLVMYEVLVNMAHLETLLSSTLDGVQWGLPVWGLIKSRPPVRVIGHLIHQSGSRTVCMDEDGW